jgi:hypothetical protein
MTVLRLPVAPFVATVRVADYSGTLESIRRLGLLREQGIDYGNPRFGMNTFDFIMTSDVALLLG